MSTKQVAVAVLVLLELLYSLSLPGGLAVALASGDEELLRLPDEASVVSVFIEAYNHPFGAADMRSGELGAEACKEVLKVFAQFGTISRSPAPYERLLEMGSVRFVDKIGKSTRVSWYFRGDKSTLRLSISGVRGRATVRSVEGEESLSLDTRIRAVLKQQQAK